MRMRKQCVPASPRWGRGGGGGGLGGGGLGGGGGGGGGLGTRLIPLRLSPSTEDTSLLQCLVVTVTAVSSSLVPRPHPDFISQPAMEKNREKAWEQNYVMDRKWWTRLVRNVDSVCTN